MANKLEFDTAPEPSTGERKLEFDTAAPLTREQEIRREKLQALVAASTPGYTTRLKDQATLGLSRPIGGAMSVVGGEIGELFGGKPATIGERWRGGVGAEDDYVRQAEKNTPGPLGTAVDVVGGLASGGGAGGKAVGLGRQMLQSGATGAVEGAARNSSDLGSAAGGAAVGGGVGAGASGILGGLLDRFKGAALKKDIGVASRGGNSQSLAQEGSDIYTRLDRAGIHYSPTETAPLAGNVAQRLADAGFNQNMQHQLIPVLGEIGGASGGRASWTQLQNMRTQISDLTAHADPRMRRVAGELKDELDNFIATAKPTMPASSVAQGVNPAQEVAEARDLWRRKSQASTVEALAEKGTRRAADPGDKVASNFDKYSDRFLDGKKYNPNSPEQMKLIDEIATGSPKTSAAAKTLDRWGSNLMGYGSAGAVGGAALPFVFPDERGVGGGATGAGLAALAIGSGMKGGAGGLRSMAARQGAEKVNDLLRNIATGATEAAPNAYVPRDMLAKLLATQNIARGAGNYGASYVNEDRSR